MQALEDRRIATVRNELIKLNGQRKDTLLKRLIQDYRNDSLVHDKMVGAIAEISGMDESVDRLTRQLGD